MDDARLALERLLSLGTRTLDGDASALREVPAALSSAKRLLGAAHDALRAMAQTTPTRFSAILAGHAAQRAKLDGEELDRLEHDCERPDAYGRSLIVAAMMLLSNLAADERRYRSSAPSGPAPATLRLV